MIFSWKYYYEPTPKNLRKWGDLWAIFWLTIASGAGLALKPYATVVFIILGALGKAFSNFFTNDNQCEEKKS